MKGSKTCVLNPKEVDHISLCGWIEKIMYPWRRWWNIFGLTSQPIGLPAIQRLLWRCFHHPKIQLQTIWPEPNWQILSYNYIISCWVVVHLKSLYYVDILYFVDSIMGNILYVLFRKGIENIAIQIIMKYFQQDGKFTLANYIM